MRQRFVCGEMRQHLIVEAIELELKEQQLGPRGIQFFLRVAVGLFTRTWSLVSPE